MCTAAGLVEERGEGKKARLVPTVGVHDIRRMVGLAVTKAAGLHVASKLLRHSDIRIAERHYAPLGLEELREVAEGQAKPLAKVLTMPAPEAHKKKAS